ncbi:MAG: DNA polymerase III subunit delta [Bacteroides sp.]|nr:DNA polymerase III subunit delta [Bacteroides sp.]
MPIMTEAQLSANIKSGNFFPVYFFYGEESFLVKTYAMRIKSRLVGDSKNDINLLELSGCPDLAMLSDHAEALPFFADRKVIMINDFDLEKLPESELEHFENILKNVPDTTVMVFYLTGCGFSLRSGRVKKLFEMFKKYAAVCEFKPLNKMKIGDIICKKAAKQKRLISPTNAEYIAEITACDLNLASVETTKLCCYVGEGKEITREIIDSMIVKRLETKVFTLSDSMLAGNKREAFRILNELFEQRVDPIPILAALSTVYSDYYTAKAAKIKGVSPQQVAADFGYTGAKASFAAKKYNQAAKMDIESLRNAMEIIFEADVRCKSSTVNRRLLLEETVLKIMDR